MLVSAVCCRLVCYCPSPSHPTILLVSAVCCRLVCYCPSPSHPTTPPMVDVASVCCLLSFGLSQPIPSHPAFIFLLTYLVAGFTVLDGPAQLRRRKRMAVATMAIANVLWVVLSLDISGWSPTKDVAAEALLWQEVALIFAAAFMRRPIFFGGLLQNRILQLLDGFQRRISGARLQILNCSA